MTTIELLEAAGIHRDLLTTTEWNKWIQLAKIAILMPKDEEDALMALHRNGPVPHGHELSKKTMEKLQQFGLAVSVIVKGEDGYRACTMDGMGVVGMIRILKEEKENRRKTEFDQQWEKASINVRRALKDFAKYPNTSHNGPYLVGFIAGADADDYWIAVASRKPADILEWIKEQ
jgi:hypothetical protein